MVDRRTGADGADVLPSLLAAWRVVFPLADIDEQSNLFDLGAESLTIIELAEEIGSAIGADVGVAFVFENETPRQQADALDAHGDLAVGGSPRDSVT